MNDRRREQLTSTIIAALQEVIARGLSDPRLEGSLVSITGANLSQDGRDITFHVSVLPEAAQSRATAALKAAAKHLRHEVGDITDVRSLPTFNFALDTSLKRQASILTTLGKIAQERDAGETDPPSETNATPEIPQAHAPAPAPHSPSGFARPTTSSPPPPSAGREGHP